MAAVEARLSTALEDRITLPTVVGTAYAASAQRLPAAFESCPQNYREELTQGRIDRIVGALHNGQYALLDRAERVAVPDCLASKVAAHIAPNRSHPGASAADVRGCGVARPRPVRDAATFY